MTFTELTRQQKDVRNDKCKEEDEWYYQSASDLFVLLRNPFVYAEANDSMMAPSSNTCAATPGPFKSLMNKQVRVHHSLP